MNNYEKHFSDELKILRNELEGDDKLIIEDFIGPIKEIFKIFSKQGHSGSSAPFYSAILSETIKKSLTFEPLSPINGKDIEWTEVGTDVFQNKRCSALFKEKNKIHYLDALIWKGEKEYNTFTGRVEGVSSSQCVKLPFTPKRFYIDVIEDGKGDYKIKDIEQFEEVIDYYDLSNEEFFPKEIFNKISRKKKLEKIDDR